MQKVAPITGITGQDGSYLSEFLLAKGYRVHCVMRRASVFTTERIVGLFARNGILLRKPASLYTFS